MIEGNEAQNPARQISGCGKRAVLAWANPFTLACHRLFDENFNRKRETSNGLNKLCKSRESTEYHESLIGLVLVAVIESYLVNGPFMTLRYRGEIALPCIHEKKAGKYRLNVYLEELTFRIGL